jgi:predicted nucleotide-binding protein
LRIYSRAGRGREVDSLEGLGTMTLDEIKACLQAAGLAISSEAPLGNGLGTCLRLENGAMVNSYHTGKFNVQGKNQDPVKECLGVPAPQAAAAVNGGGAAAKPVLSKVFVVYGHDTAARTELEAMLRRWKLEPLILDQLPSEGQTIIEKLEKTISGVNFAVVLATPDDEGHRAGHEDEKAFRARQNVVMELGMMLTLLGRRNVAILMKQQDNMERPSDIQGLIYIPYKDNLQKEAGLLLAKEMQAQGYPISLANV